MARRGGEACSHVTVYIWAPSLRNKEIGHAMATRHLNPSQIYLNEFPINPAVEHSEKILPRWSLQQTIAHYKGRQPKVYTVLVPNLQLFAATAAEHRQRKYWDIIPHNDKNETNCSYSVYCALRAGGVKITTPVLIPYDLEVQIEGLKKVNNIYQNYKWHGFS